MEREKSDEWSSGADPRRWPCARPSVQLQQEIEQRATYPAVSVILVGLLRIVVRVLERREAAVVLGLLAVGDRGLGAVLAASASVGEVARADARLEADDLVGRLDDDAALVAWRESAERSQWRSRTAIDHSERGAGASRGRLAMAIGVRDAAAR